MGLCVLYYVEYSLYNVKKVGFFYLGWNYTLSPEKQIHTDHHSILYYTIPVFNDPGDGCV